MIIGFGLGAVSQWTNLLHWPLTQGLLDSLYGFLLGGGFFYAIGIFYYFISKRVGLGGGDIKLMAMLGAILGWPAIFPTVLFGSFLGSFAGITLILFKKEGRHTEIPFGPWLSLGAIIYIFLSPQIALF